MDENLFVMSIDDIHTNKSVNLATEYHFRTIDDDIAEIKKSKSSNSKNVVSVERPDETKSDAK